MWVVCKRRKVDSLDYKRKLPDNNYNSNPSKRLCFYPDVNNKKRKLDSILVFQKRQKYYHDFCHCHVHVEKYICDIYECSGIGDKDVTTEYHMPYII